MGYGAVAETVPSLAHPVWLNTLKSDAAKLAKIIQQHLKFSLVFGQELPCLLSVRNEVETSYNVDTRDL